MSLRNELCRDYAENLTAGSNFQVIAADSAAEKSEPLRIFREGNPWGCIPNRRDLIFKVHCLMFKPRLETLPQKNPNHWGFFERATLEVASRADDNLIIKVHYLMFKSRLETLPTEKADDPAFEGEGKLWNNFHPEQAIIWLSKYIIWCLNRAWRDSNPRPFGS